MPFNSTIPGTPPTPEEQKLIQMDERIDNFIFGKMSLSEEKQFLEDCKHNKTLRERARIVALLAKAIREINPLDI